MHDTPTEIEYELNRARQEDDAAAAAVSIGARRAHRRLAALHIARAERVSHDAVAPRSSSCDGAPGLPDVEDSSQWTRSGLPPYISPPIDRGASAT